MTSTSRATPATRTALRVVGAITLALSALGADAGPVSGLAEVRDDGSLEIRGHVYVLWGVHVPRTRSDCLAHRRPRRCGEYAALALEQLIEGFVRCEPVFVLDHAATVARCVTGYGYFEPGTDLAAYLLNRGWAVANADAPADYRLREAVARKHGLGIWGLPLALEP